MRSIHCQHQCRSIALIHGMNVLPRDKFCQIAADLEIASLGSEQEGRDSVLCNSPKLAHTLSRAVRSDRLFIKNTAASMLLL